MASAYRRRLTPGVVFAAIFLLATPALCVRSLADEPRASTPTERFNAFEWFRSLGYPDVADCPLVQVNELEMFVGESIDGFLLSTDDKSWIVLTTNLETRVFAKPFVGGRRICTVDKADLAKFAATTLNEAHELPPEYTDEPDWADGPSQRTSLFVLAWACSRHGLHGEAARLFDAALNLPREDADGAQLKVNLRELLAADLAAVELFRTVESFADIRLSREQLLKKYQSLVKHFPNSAQAEQAGAFADLLGQMIAEDRAHAERRKAGPALDKLPLQEQIAELIFELRDQTSDRGSTTTPDHIFDTSDRKPETPAHRLVEIGYDAVPRLIEALGDKRLTRSVCGSDPEQLKGDILATPDPAHRVLTVGDCAIEILERIAGRHFYRPDHPAGFVPQEGQTQTVEAQVREWYAELLAKGEQRMLAEATARADANSLQQATRLVEKYPNEALAPLIAGCRAADHNDDLRRGLIALAGRLGTKPAQDFLLERLEAEPTPLGRLAAAEELRKLGRPEGVAVMVKRWEALRGAPPVEPGPDDRTGVAEFLVRSRRVEAVKALTDGFAEQSDEIRKTIVVGLTESDYVKDASLGQRDAALRAALEELLVAALDDTQRVFVHFGELMREARVCDVAVKTLNQIDPRRFPFDLDTWRRDDDDPNHVIIIRDDDRSRVILKNVWLKEHGQPELPLPETKRR